MSCLVSPHAGQPIHAELSPVTDFREACCRQYEMGSVKGQHPLLDPPIALCCSLGNCNTALLLVAELACLTGLV